MLRTPTRPACFPAAVAPADLPRAPLSGGGGAPAWLPDGVTVFADPKNGHYWDGEAEASAADLFTDPANIEAGVGYKIRDGGVSDAFAGALHAALASESATIVVEYDFTDWPGGIQANGTFGVNNSDDSFELYYLTVSKGGNANIGGYENGPNSTYAQTLSVGAEVLISKVAASYSRTNVSISVNGAAAVTGTPVTALVGLIENVLINEYAPTDLISGVWANMTMLAVYPLDYAPLDELSA